ncbi:MAG TPA: hypothetical protein VFA07_01460 [Chthonomonadaceae bacterium]|nr:hypothetical protein [Chthonomonadaceae bacterium]
MTGVRKQEKTEPSILKAGKLTLHKETVRELSSRSPRQGQVFNTHNCPTDLASCYSFQPTCFGM